MYTPKLYREPDKKFLLDFMRRFSFATLVSAKENFPQATHLPFVIEEREDKFFLTTHMAKANPQWKDFSEEKILVIFQEPHGYVSTQHYEHEVNVPTWNYVAIHAYGRVKILPSRKEKISVLEKMFSVYEREFQEQWENLPEKYKENLLRGIVAFEIEVEEIQGKQKLSQNKTFAEREKIIQHFEESTFSSENSLAGFMKNYPYKSEK